MRVVSGEKRGLKLHEVPSTVTCRPTADKVKEAMFDIIRFRLRGRVLDLFGGTGQLGIEALSNGCESVVICDNNADSIGLITRNVAKAKFEDRAKVLHIDYKRFLRHQAKKHEFNVIFLDPPYAGELLEKSMKYIDEGEILAPDGIVVAESAAETEVPETFGNLKLEKRYKYGTVAVRIYSYEKEDVQ